MRHFRDELRAKGLTVHYVALSDSNLPALVQRLAEQLQRHRPALLRMVEAGEWRLQQDIAAAAQAVAVPLRALDDTHFMCSRADFMRWAAKYGKSPGSSLRMEFFYREMRRTHRVLLAGDGGPEGGQWNFDADHRKGYPKAGPGLIPPPEFFEPDAVTREVFAEVEARFPDHPGTLAHFAWPVNRAQALIALRAFVETRLVNFGDHQDAMWSATPFGWHSLLSTSLNMHMLDPREVIAAAEAAYRQGAAPLAGVEGFIRQVLGWREFIRGVYWPDMPGIALYANGGRFSSKPYAASGAYIQRIGNHLRALHPRAHGERRCQVRQSPPAPLPCCTGTSCSSTRPSWRQPAHGPDGQECGAAGRGAAGVDPQRCSRAAGSAGPVVGCRSAGHRWRDRVRPPRHA